MKVCDDFMSNTRFKLSEEKKQELHEKNREATRKAMKIALTTIEDFFPEVVNEANNPYFNEVQRICTKKSFLTDPLYMQNVIIYTATMLVDFMLDDSELKLILHCRVTSVDIDCTTEADKDFLVVTFEYPNNNEIENYRIAVPCKVKNDYIRFNSFKEE